jgi:glycosyltransferase involved in cell wall biosynthesis
MQEMASYTERILTFEAVRHPEPAAEGRTRALSRLGERIRRARRTRGAVREMKRAFLQLVQQESYDLVVFHGKDVFSVIEDWDSLPIVADFCDATSLRITGRMRYASMAELPWLLWRYLKARRIEKKLIRKTPHLAFISCRDREAILGPGSRAQVLPNIVDLQYWTRKTNNPQPNCIMYSGGMDYRPNVDGALYLIKKILPLVRQSIPNLQVLVVGRDPLPELMETAQHYPYVTITGSVEDMRPYFERATVYAAPLRFASGQQNKLLEAMAMEVPVVTTPVAAAGLRIDNEVEPPVVVADGEKQFAEYIIYLLRREEDRARLASEGRRFIEDHFVWSRSTEVLEKMCIDAVEHAKRRQQRVVGGDTF